jgi:hypothetical protein
MDWRLAATRKKSSDLRNARCPEPQRQITGVQAAILGYSDDFGTLDEFLRRDVRDADAGVIVAE